MILVLENKALPLLSDAKCALIKMKAGRINDFIKNV
jgi:hypothetical protein